MEERKDELSDGEISIGSSTESLSSHSDILCPPEMSILNQNSKILTKSHSLSMTTAREQDGGGAPKIGSTESSSAQSGSTSQTTEIKDLLFDFHNIRNEKDSA